MLGHVVAKQANTEELIRERLVTFPIKRKNIFDEEIEKDLTVSNVQFILVD